ncbi:MAG: autotransporter-associated beta strand repeat-containing protein, partial [Verrucomicrobiota bacterium]
MKNIHLVIAVAGAIMLSAMPVETYAQSGVIVGQLWTNQLMAASDAVFDNIPTSPPDVTFTVPNGSLNFDSEGTTYYTIGGFLTNSGATVVSGVSHAADGLDNSVMLLTGFVSVTNGSTISVVHDDGFTLQIGCDFVMSAPGVTAAETTTATYSGPSGDLPFQLFYGECCGPPAVLSVDLLLTEALQITPAAGFDATRCVGGPFSITNGTFSLTNTWTSSLDWSLANTSSWLDASPTNGTLAASGSTNVTVTLNSNAYSLPSGYYTATVWFTNLNDGVVQSCQFTLADPPPPPTITIQPVPVTVPNGASCAFLVSATGANVTYQWCRNGMNLLDGGNISGSSSSMLVISPAGPADVASGTNGYYVTVSSAGGCYSTNSVTNSLALTTATNLIYTGNSGPTWDLNNSVNWEDTTGNPQVFNFGDPVTFNDVGFGGPVTLTGPYLSAASVTVTGRYAYNFSSASSGSFAGPGNLLYTGTGYLTIGNTNTYTGGTVISNATGILILQNLSGLGTGPVTNALAGGLMEITVAGSASSSIPNDFVIATNFTIQIDGTGTYAGDFSGNFSGNPGAKLTFMAPAANSPANERVRFYGTNTTYNGNLVLSNALITLAPYEASGFTQTYNGVISGTGALTQRGGGTTILNGANTYSGGTTPSAGAIGFGINTSPTVGTVTNGPIGTGPLYIAPEVCDLTGNGQVFAFGGARTIGNLIQFPSRTDNLTLIIGGTNNLTFTGAFNLAGLNSLGINNIRILQVTNTGLTTISGVISDGGLGYGFIKTGGGVLALNNAETCTGSTTVSDGTLQVNGSLNAASAVTVNLNATLAGTGTINGPVTVNAGGTLAPGASIGTITLSGGLTLKGNLFFEINTSVSPSNDYAVVTGTLT